MNPSRLPCPPVCLATASQCTECSCLVHDTYGSTNRIALGMRASHSPTNMTALRIPTLKRVACRARPRARGYAQPGYQAHREASTSKFWLRRASYSLGSYSAAHLVSWSSLRASEHTPRLTRHALPPDPSVLAHRYEKKPAQRLIHLRTRTNADFGETEAETRVWVQAVHEQ
ncbi:hypothetical protein MSAN_00526500 [Mycena sanguinolenta]|uniref:Uncharacterized protein n=1 Tax=Mycena sanguinolenta TaxID=230812 RepID=A0A8H7DF53_9AGAR|nr:hypothetical protein MSAN_00526500 [Mycena sanguinolenta]